MNTIYYIYAYLDTRKCGDFKYTDLSFKYEPFYIGKGCKSRDISHLNEAYNLNKNSHKCNLIRKIKNITGSDPIIIKLYDNLSEDDAYILEADTISKIGRTFINTGPLTNILDGGLCGSGSGKRHPLYGTTRPDAVKLKISNTLTGHVLSDQTKTKLSANMLGVPKSKQHAENISKGKRGVATVHHNEASKEKIAEAQRGLKHHSSKHLIFINPNGKIFHIYSNFQKFVKDNNLTLAVVRKYINMGKIPPPSGHRYGDTRLNTTGWIIEDPNVLDTKTL